MIEQFSKYLLGTFTNEEQASQVNVPLTKVKNTLINEQISSLPSDFDGMFIFEDISYYSHGITRNSKRLFLVKEEANGISLRDYVIPSRFNKNNLEAQDLNLDYTELVEISELNKLVLTKESDKYQGMSVSMLSPIKKYTTFKEVSSDKLAIMDELITNGIKTYGFLKTLELVRI